MKARIAIVFLFLICLVSTSQAKPKAAAPHPRAVASQDLNGDQVQGLKEDLARMKALVQQMETNLSVVDTSQSPLKHQFQLEIDMWRMMIRQMERKLNKSK